MRNNQNLKMNCSFAVAVLAMVMLLSGSIYPVAAETGSAQPDAAKGKTDSGSTQSESAASEPDSGSTQPESAASKPDSSSAQSEPAASKTDSAAAQTEPAASKTESAAAQSEPAAAKTEQRDSATKKQPDLKTLVAICPSVRIRIDKDHRVRLSEEKYKGQKRIHIYAYLSEQPLPYMISLGWFNTREEVGPNLSPDKKGGVGLGISAVSVFKVPVLVPLKVKDAPAPQQVTSGKISVAVDELGFVLPLYATEPTEKNYDKAAWNGVLGFDKVGTNDMNAAEKYFSEAVKIAPINPKLNNNLGAVLAGKGDYEAASAFFDRAIRENNAYTAAYVNRAFLFIALGKPDKALADATKAISLEPTLIPARVAYGRALMEAKQPEEALKVAQNLKQDAPAEWQSMLLLADALLENKEYKESKSTLARLSVLSPGNANLALKLAHANEKTGDLDEAIKQARKATQLAPNEPATHMTLGKYLDANRDANGARLQFERTMDLKPNRNIRKSAMGAILRILIAQQKLPLADDASKKWVKQYAEDSECHYNRAWILSQLEGDHAQECIDEYRKALEQQPDLISVHYNLALILLKAGKNQEALQELKTFVSAAPNDSDCASAQELIKKLEPNG